MQYIRELLSPLGPMTMASDGTALTGLWFNGQKYFPEGLAAAASKDLSVFRKTCYWLDRYFSGVIPDFTPPLKPEGSPFRQTVWTLLQEIPYGKTRTYGDLARQLAEMRGLPSMSAQAVGGAVGHNPISLIIPCHRVLGSDGSLTGYAGGLDRKRALLRLEHIL